MQFHLALTSLLLFNRMPVKHEANVYSHSVVLTGLSAAFFDQLIDNIHTIDRRLSREFRDELWIPWSPIDFHGHRAFLCSNRLLTPEWQCDGTRGREIPNEIDPKRFLQAVVEADGSQYLAENVVHFKEHLYKE